MTPDGLMSTFASRTATIFLATIAMLFTAQAGNAGSAPGQFVGRWTIQSGGTDGCTLELQSERSGDHLVARSKGCKGTLASVRAWKPVPRGLSLFGKDGTAIVTFEPVRGILFGRLVDGTLVAIRRMHD